MDFTTLKEWLFEQYPDGIPVTEDGEEFIIRAEASYEGCTFNIWFGDFWDCDFEDEFFLDWDDPDFLGILADAIEDFTAAEPE
ncbi:MAG: hypothetical protein HUJ26_19050 [Planctomycetaceae bacterium]|nr:hypothetical protein [Planctomycetaceae bacterium]